MCDCLGKKTVYPVPMRKKKNENLWYNYINWCKEKIICGNFFKLQ